MIERSLKLAIDVKNGLGEPANSRKILESIAVPNDHELFSAYLNKKNEDDLDLVHDRN